jgi:hypothetical protein
MGTRSAAFVVLAVAALLPGGAAAIEQSYVSVEGRNAWPCTRARPCRTFARAYAVTDPGGSIVALDSGRFASSYLDIRKAITITAAPGVHAEIATSDFGVYVNAASTDVVVLRGLVFRGAPETPNTAIVLNSAQALHVENCVISGFPTYGIGTYGSNNQLYVRDTVIRDTYMGISFFSQPVSHASLDRVRLEHNDFGLGVFKGQVTVRDSVASGNAEVGFLVDGYGDAQLNLEDCMASNNGHGIRASSAGPNDRSVARISHCVVTGNESGIVQWGNAVVETRGTSTVAGNGTDVSGTLTPLAGR